MRYLKAGLAGLLYAVVFAVGSAVIELLLALRGSTAGIGAVSVGILSALPAAILGFVVGFVFTLRRTRGRLTVA